MKQVDTVFCLRVRGVIQNKCVLASIERNEVDAIEWTRVRAVARVIAVSLIHYILLKQDRFSSLFVRLVVCLEDKETLSWTSIASRRGQV